MPVVHVGECTVERLTWGPGESLVHARRGWGWWGGLGGLGGPGFQAHSLFGGAQTPKGRMDSKA